MLLMSELYDFLQNEFFNMKMSPLTFTFECPTIVQCIVVRAKLINKKHNFGAHDRKNIVF